VALIKLYITDDVSFSDLRLTREPDGDLAFDVEPILKICAASGVDHDVFLRGPEANLAELFFGWYMEHLARCGERDAVMDDLITETEMEDRFGGGLSFRPGRG
jgi:hypothetical protein